MSKTMRLLLALGLILAVAAPAFAAEFKFNGQYKLMMYNEVKKWTTNEDGDSQQFIDQRFRAKMTYSLNDNVAVVYYAEIDTPWGEPGKAAYGQGGMVTYRTGGADGVNVETKNAYLDLKFNNTNVSLGIQGVADSFESIVANDDMAAVKVVHKIGNTTLTGAYSKWDEDNGRPDGTTTYTFDLDQNKDGDIDQYDFAGFVGLSDTEIDYIIDDYLADGALGGTSLGLIGDIETLTATGKAKANVYPGGRSDWDDFDFYLAEVKHKFNDSFTAGAGVYFMDDNDADEYDTAEKDVWFYGLNGAFTSGDFGVNGFVMMQDGEYDPASGSGYDFFGWAASAKGTMKIANGDIGLRLIYFSEDDDDSDNGRWQGFQGEYAFVNENQLQFLVDKHVANDSKEQYAIKDAIDGGYGLFAAILSGNHKLQQDIYANWGLGYYAAIDDERDDAGSASREGKTLGYEIAGRIGKVFFEKVDVSVNASYAIYGDFYDETVTGDDPDNTYKTYLMVNVPW